MQSDHALLARIDERVNMLVKNQAERDTHLEKMDGRLENLEIMAHRYKGAFGLILGLGALIGWLISTFNNVSGWFAK